MNWLKPTQLKDVERSGIPGSLLSDLARVLVFLIFFIVYGASAEPLDLGSRRELFVDNYLIASKTNVQFTLHEPRDEGSVLLFNASWEGAFCAYCTVINDGQRFRVYYRGK